MIGTVKYDERLPTVLGYPAKLLDSGQPIWHVVEHVHRHGDIHGVIGHRQRCSVANQQGGVRGSAAGCRQHPGGQIDADYTPCMVAASQLSQVSAIPATDIGNCLGT